MNTQERELLKSKLLESKNAVNERIHILQLDKTRNHGAVSQDYDEQALEIENDEVIDQLEQIEFIKLSNIEKALSMVDNDTYGICSDCGDTIPSARLMAMPYATKCVACSTPQ